MRMNTNIPMMGQPVNALANFGAGIQTAQLANEVGDQNRLRDVFSTQGAGIMQGDQGALEALATTGHAGGQMALGVQQHQQEMQINQERLNIARQTAARQSAEFALQLADRERDQVFNALITRAPAALAAAEQGDIAGFNAAIDPYREVLGFEPAQSAREMEFQAAGIAGMSEGFQSVYSASTLGPGPQLTTANQTLTQRAEMLGLQQGTPEYEEFIRTRGETTPPGSSIVLPDGTRVDLAGGSGNMDLTQAQGANYGFGIRAQDSDALLTQFEVSGLNLGENLSEMVPFGAGNYLVSDEYQQFSQAARDFINATLRRESGAVISDDEFANARQQYLPVPGDSPAVLAQKRRNRQNVIQSMIVQSGPAAALFGQTGPQATPPAGSGTSAPPPSGGAQGAPLSATGETPTVQSQADYDAIPPGGMYFDPQGNLRQRPEAN